MRVPSSRKPSFTQSNSLSHHIVPQSTALGSLPLPSICFLRTAALKFPALGHPVLSPRLGSELPFPAGTHSEVSDAGDISVMWTEGAKARGGGGGGRDAKGEREGALGECLDTWQAGRCVRGRILPDGLGTLSLDVVLGLS